MQEMLIRSQIKKQQHISPSLKCYLSVVRQLLTPVDHPLKVIRSHSHYAMMDHRVSSLSHCCISVAVFHSCGLPSGEGLCVRRVWSPVSRDLL